MPLCLRLHVSSSAPNVSMPDGVGERPGVERAEVRACRRRGRAPRFAPRRRRHTRARRSRAARRARRTRPRERVGTRRRRARPARRPARLRDGSFGRQHRLELAADLGEAVCHRDHGLAREVARRARRPWPPRRPSSSATITRSSAFAASALVAGSSVATRVPHSLAAARDDRRFSSAAIPRPGPHLVPDRGQARRQSPAGRTGGAQHSDFHGSSLACTAAATAARWRPRTVRRCSRRRGGSGARQRGRCSHPRRTRRRVAAPWSCRSLRGARTSGCRPGAHGGSP